MRSAFEVLRQPLIIGALVLSVLIVVGAYFGSHWYYGDVESIDIPAQTTFVPSLSVSVPEANLEGLQMADEPANIESQLTVPTADNESVDDFLASLSDEEKALLASEVVPEPERVSPFGFGPYPEIPSDFPYEPIWMEYQDVANGTGGSKMMRAMELIDRVLVELWSQDRHAESGEINDNDMVLPYYPNTVYVQWDYLEHPDGTTTRYAAEMTSAPGLPESVFDAIKDGATPSGITILDPGDYRIDPFTFLNLN